MIDREIYHYHMLPKRIVHQGDFKITIIIVKQCSVPKMTVDELLKSERLFSMIIV